MYTDLRTHKVGTSGRHDRTEDRFDTPALVELWRTAPFLHDGSAATLRDVLTTRNLQDQHGRTSHLSPQALDDLAEYLRSL
jgi:cytochrome c peroxidase